MSLALMRFNGSDYIHQRDSARLTGQLSRIWQVMQDGQWRSLAEISAITGDPPASISAQLRHLRKPRFGSHIVDKMYLGNGHFKYRVTFNEFEFLA